MKRTPRPHLSLPLLGLVVLAQLLAATPARAAGGDDGGRWVMPGGKEAEIQALFPSAAYASPAAAGHRLAGISVEFDAVRLRFVPAGEGAAAIWLALRPPDAAGAIGTTRFFTVHPDEGWDGGGAQTALAAWVTETVSAREKTQLWTRAVPGASGGKEPALRVGRLTAEGVWVRWIVPAHWILLLAFGLAAVGRRLRRLEPSRTLLLLAGLTLLALALRLWLAPFGPGDIKNTVLDAYRGWPGGTGLEEVDRYGRAPEGLFVWLFLLVPPDDYVVAGVNLLLGCLSVPLVYALGRRIGLARTACLTAALLLAVAPLHVRFSPSINRLIPLVFLSLAGWTTLLAWLIDRRRVDLVVGVVCLVLASQCRPEAVVLPAVTAALLLLRGAGWRTLVPLVPNLLLLAIPATPLLVRAFAGGADVDVYLDAGRPLFDPDHNAFLSSYVTPAVWPALAALGLLVGPRLAVLWLAGAGLGLAALLCGAPVVEQPHLAGQILNARYHLTALPLLLLLAGNGVEVVRLVVARWAPRGALPVSALVAVGVAGCAAVTMPNVTRDATMNAEYRFLRTHLAAVPDGCQLVYYYPPSDEGLRQQDGVSVSLGLEHAWVQAERWEAERGGKGGCAVFFQGSPCSTRIRIQDRAGQDVCRRMRAIARETIAEEDVPRVPIREETYLRDPLPLGLYWLER